MLNVDFVLDLMVWKPEMIVLLWAVHYVEEKFSM